MPGDPLYDDEEVEKRVQRRLAEEAKKREAQEQKAFLDGLASKLDAQEEKLAKLQADMMEMAEANAKLADAVFSVEQGQLSKQAKAKVATYAVGGSSGIVAALETLRWLLQG